MSIKFIGSGSGKTSLKRFHSSILFSTNDFVILVDAGDGISKALLSLNISFNEIDGILISHLHPDHFAGLSGLIIQMKLIKRTKKLKIFIHKNLIENVKNFLFQSYIFSANLSFEIVFIEFEESKELTIVKNFKFISKQNSHLEKYKKFDENNLLSFSSSSFLFFIDDKKIFYTGDIGHKSDLFSFKDYEIDLLITEISHVSLEEINSAGIILKAKKIYLTHISDVDEENINSFFKSLNEDKRGKFVTAYDGLSFNL